jgi:hypothetical protein
MTPATPGLERVFQIEAEIEAPRGSGPSPLGERLHIPILGGTVRGPRLQGRVLAGGSDWPVVGPDGISRIDARYSIEAEDGTLIYLVNRGMRTSSDAVRQRMRAGDVVPPEDYYMRSVAVFDAPDGPHRWLSEHIFLCSVAPAGKVVRIDVYLVT